MKKKKLFIPILLVLTVLFSGCTASGKNLDLSPYSSGDFDSLGAIKVETDEASYKPGVSEISYTISNGSPNDVYYGISYSIEMKRGETWYQVPFKETTAWIAIAYQLDAGQSQTYTADLSMLKFNLDAGEYRLVKQVGEMMYAAEFTVAK